MKPEPDIFGTSPLPSAAAIVLGRIPLLPLPHQSILMHVFSCLLDFHDSERLNRTEAVTGFLSLKDLCRLLPDCSPRAIAEIVREIGEYKLEGVSLSTFPVRHSRDVDIVEFVVVLEDEENGPDGWWFRLGQWHHWQFNNLNCTSFGAICRAWIKAEGYSTRSAICLYGAACLELVSASEGGGGLWIDLSDLRRLFSRYQTDSSGSGHFSSSTISDFEIRALDALKESGVLFFVPLRHERQTPGTSSGRRIPPQSIFVWSHSTPDVSWDAN